jgi:hypothetical protein
MAQPSGKDLEAFRHGQQFLRKFVELAPNDSRTPSVRKLLADYDQQHR